MGFYVWYIFKREDVFNILINYCYVGSNDGLKYISKEELIFLFVEGCFVFFCVIIFFGKIILLVYWFDLSLMKL